MVLIIHINKHIATKKMVIWFAFLLLGVCKGFIQPLFIVQRAVKDNRMNQNSTLHLFCMNDVPMAHVESVVIYLQGRQENSHTTLLEYYAGRELTIHQHDIFLLEDAYFQYRTLQSKVFIDRRFANISFTLKVRENPISEAYSLWWKATIYCKIEGDITQDSIEVKTPKEKDLKSRQSKYDRLKEIILPKPGVIKGKIQLKWVLEWVLQLDQDAATSAVVQPVGDLIVHLKYNDIDDKTRVRMQVRERDYIPDNKKLEPGIATSQARGSFTIAGTGIVIADNLLIFDVLRHHTYNLDTFSSAKFRLKYLAFDSPEKEIIYIQGYAQGPMTSRNPELSYTLRSGQQQSTQSNVEFKIQLVCNVDQSDGGPNTQWVFVTKFFNVTVRPKNNLNNLVAEFNNYTLQTQRSRVTANLGTNISENQMNISVTYKSNFGPWCIIDQKYTSSIGFQCIYRRFSNAPNLNPTAGSHAEIGGVSNPVYVKLPVGHLKPHITIDTSRDGDESDTEIHHIRCSMECPSENGQLIFDVENSVKYHNVKLIMRPRLLMIYDQKGFVIEHEDGKTGCPADRYTITKSYQIPERAHAGDFTGFCRGYCNGDAGPLETNQIGGHDDNCATYAKNCHNGTCIQLGDKPHCDCDSHFEGLSCEYINPCEPNPCYGPGKCTIEVGVHQDRNFTCLCKYPRFGNSCELIVDHEAVYSCWNDERCYRFVSTIFMVVIPTLSLGMLCNICCKRVRVEEEEQEEEELLRRKTMQKAGENDPILQWLQMLVDMRYTDPDMAEQMAQQFARRWLKADKIIKKSPQKKGEVEPGPSFYNIAQTAKQLRFDETKTRNKKMKQVYEKAQILEGLKSYELIGARAGNLLPYSKLAFASKSPKK